MRTTIPHRYIENYSNALNGITSNAKKALIVALEKVDYSRPAAEVRNTVIALMQMVCGASTDLSARLSAEFYDGLRLYMMGKKIGAVAVSGRNPESTEGAIRAFIQVIVDDSDVDRFIELCVDRLDYENNRAANECVAVNARRDSLKPKWARVPMGEETCEFCLMLASRGFVYSSYDLASHSHANCDCRVVPGWNNNEIEKYNADEYFNEYLNVLNVTTSQHASRMVDDVSSTSRAMRKVRRGSKFSGVAEMNNYLKGSSSVDELYERSGVVFQDFKKFWNTDDNASRSMFDSISRTAKAVRKALM